MYHLTASSNVASIVERRELLSAKRVAETVGLENISDFVRTRRPHHVVLESAGRAFHVRDQRPISERALAKCLSNGMTVGDYLELLNERIFFWATTDRLNRHYVRYRDEKPTILRFKTADIISLNSNVELCRLNSGATRANYHLGGKPPLRGRETFSSAARFSGAIGAVAEVTLVDRCILPSSIHKATSPYGPWRLV